MIGLIAIAVIVVLMLAVGGIMALLWEVQERRRLMRLLRAKQSSLATLDIPTFNETLWALERSYDAHYSSCQARVLDTTARALNICPLCGAYLCVEKPPARSGHHWRTPIPSGPRALVCTNSPTCDFRKDLSDASRLALKA